MVRVQYPKNLTKKNLSKSRSKAVNINRNKTTQETLPVLRERKFVLVEHSTWNLTVTQKRNNAFIVLSLFNTITQTSLVVDQISFRSVHDAYRKSYKSKEKLISVLEPILSFITKNKIFIIQIIFINSENLVWNTIKIFEERKITPFRVQQLIKAPHNGCKLKKKRHDR